MAFSPDRQKLLLREYDVAEFLGVDYSTLRKNKNFPAPVYAGQKGYNLWRRSDLEKWVESLPQTKFHDKHEDSDEEIQDDN